MILLVALAVANVSLDELRTDQAECAAELEAEGGYLPYGLTQQSCLRLGRPGPARDLSAEELEAIETWCPVDVYGPACGSIAQICNVYRDGEKWPSLRAACMVRDEALLAPQDPGIRDLWFGFGVGRVDEPAQLDATTTLAVDLTMHGILGLKKVAPGLSFDLQLGSTTDGGFLYRVASAFGVGVRLGDDGIVTATIGGGLSGITGDRVGFALEIPVQVIATLPVGPSLRLMAAARGSMIFREDPRQDGVPGMPIYDEVEARAGIAYRMPRGNLFGIYGFAQHLRETAIIGAAIAVGQVDVIGVAGTPSR